MSALGGESSNGDRLITSERVELVVALILAATVVAMAWSAFQSAKWGSAMTVSFNEAGVDRAIAANDIAQASRDISGDRSTFSAYVLALAAGEDEAAQILFTEFRDEVQPLIESWLDKDPFANPNVGSPFDDPGYSVLETLDEAAMSLTSAEAHVDEALVARGNSGNYTLTMVLFAVVLFIGGLSGQIKSRRISLALIAFGGLLLIVGISMLVALPTII